MRKTGLFGGTFDPIHRAHLSLAQAALTGCGLDRVVFLPAGDPYFKSSSRAITSAEKRAEMVRLAIEPYSRFELSTIELEREGHTYTADTLAELSKKLPEDEFTFLCGADTLLQMETWYRPEVIFRLAGIAVGVRDGSDRAVLAEKAAELTARYGARIRILDWPEMEISSTAVREDPDLDDGIYRLVPEPVAEYIVRHGLYRRQLCPLDNDQVLEKLRGELRPSRVEHTVGVAETALKLARAYGASPQKAYLAGLLHDCAKMRAGALTHAEAGAKLARDEYGVTDEEILDAIRTHTVGAPAMSLLQEILFVADYIEPGRDRSAILPMLRESAYRDLDQTVLNILSDTRNYLFSKGEKIDARFDAVYTYYRNVCSISEE